jgi:hypothetical protein
VALKANIARNVSAAQVAGRAPREFEPFVDLRRLNGGPYTVIAFPGMRGESSSIVDSAPIAKALAKVEGSDQVVVIAHDFTAEVRAKLEQLGAIFFFQRDGGWTDERWRHIRDDT